MTTEISTPCPTVLASVLLALAVMACSSTEGIDCTPQCGGGRECGSDGCGDVCGVCAPDQFCSASWTCVDASDPTAACQDLSTRRSSRPVGDLYVTRQGEDSNDGRSYETAFATIQRGLDELQTGQTLIIGPGEYFGSVHRGTFIDWEFGETLGSPYVDTVIRAEIPGTVIIRGDLPAPSFTRLEGFHHLYVADFEQDIDIITVNELDTLMVLPERASLGLLDYLPGSFYQDREAGRLYLSSSDLQPASEHRYSLSVVQDHGFALINATRVIVDGISVTGFNMERPVYSWNDFTAYTVWGILLMHSQDCVIRNSRAFFNARGIGVTSTTRDLPFGGNLIEGCMAWANDSPVSTEDTGGITLDATIADTVRDSVAFLNGGVGINIYGGDETSLIEGNGSVLSHNLSWGNEVADYKIKTGEEHGHRTEYSIGLGTFSHSTTPDQCLVGGDVIGAGEDTIVLQAEAELDLDAEFADPDHFDFRLQSTSRFRGAMSDGSDRGPEPFQRNVFFVSTSGNDALDGMSLSTAWRSFAHAANVLDVGDTLYLLPGTYDEDVTWMLRGTESAPISIRGRGAQPVILTGQWNVLESQNLDLRRLTFTRVLRLDGCDSVSLDNNTYLAPDRGILAANTVGLRATHGTFTGFSTAAIDLPCSVDAYLAGNLYDNVESPALHMGDDSAVQYADYNSYARVEDAWQVGDASLSFEDVSTRYEPDSQALAPDFSYASVLPTLENAIEFAFGGPYREPFGTYRTTVPERSIQLVDAPRLHSVSATTANIEWMTNLPTVASITWGARDSTETTLTYPAQSFATLSLTELTPGTTYTFRIDSLALPDSIDLDAQPLAVGTEPLTFTTRVADDPPQVYFVSTSGNDDHDGLSIDSSWRTLQNAADRVAVGDTVRIASGHYGEQVYLHATGSAEQPITFTNQPGERVYLDGLGTLLSNAFVVAGKSHLVFDGLYFLNHGDNNPWSASFTPAAGGDFNLYRSTDITISRCLASTDDFQGSSVVAREIDHLTLDNVVLFNHFNPLYLHYAQHTVVRHSVFVRPWIYTMILYLDPFLPLEPATFDQCIFTDSFEMKAEQNVPLFYSGPENFVMTDCVFVLREEQPPEWRTLTTDTTVYDAPNSYLDPLFVDPLFAAVEDLIEAGLIDSDVFAADALLDENVVIDFNAFFVTEPTVTDLGIGLEPERFDADGVPD